MRLSDSQVTNEGLDVCFTVSYTSRMRLLSTLLSALNRSARPRVLSVLNGSRGGYIDGHDLGLAKNWSIWGLVNHTTLFTSLAFDGIATESPKLTLIRNASGIVESDNPRRRRALVGVPYLRRIYIGVARLIYKLMRFFIGM